MELVRVLRKVSACAFPRPSAIASARFAKITVPQSQATIHHVKTLECWIARTDVKIAPISTTNITGFLDMMRGSSLRTAAGISV